ncbi:hypothetical protein E2C01_064210 [Portunus trituberculatus]|uniref:Uncharacterized protein n=1 Tax=Portunus trituberculatus TaxID=210409 RepID=A0A5B7HL42_PORTR|nr:hypothetical protein [Portunus trituberculatus]
MQIRRCLRVPCWCKKWMGAVVDWWTRADVVITVHSDVSRFPGNPPRPFGGVIRDATGGKVARDRAW